MSRVRWRGVAWAVVAGSSAFGRELSAQPVRQERRTVAWHADLLHELWLATRGAPAPVQAKLDQALLETATNPFVPLARALAVHLEVACDADFLTRRLVHVNALPEIVDPNVFEDTNAGTPYRLHVTLHTPYHLNETRPLTFALALRAAAGKVVWEGEVGPTDADDAAMFAATTAIPMQARAEGWYEVTASLRLGDEASRADDPVGRARVLLQPGFAARALALGERASQLLAACDDPVVRSAMWGAITPVQRVYTGDATDGTPDLEHDLRHAVLVLDNVDARRPPLSGATGFFAVGVELEASPDPDTTAKLAHVRVRLPVATDEPAAAPLVLFVVGAPTWDGAWSRPSAVSTMPPGWMAQALVVAGFDANQSRVCAVMQSVSEFSDPRGVVTKVIDVLGKLVPIDPERVLLIGEREAAHTMLACARPGVLATPPRGVVVVAGGALAHADVGILATTRVLVVPGLGHASLENLRRMAAFAEASGHAERVTTLPSRAWPWAMRLALPTIATFAHDLGL